MQPGAQPGAQMGAKSGSNPIPPAPAFPAQLTVAGTPWSSALAPDGVVYLAKPEVHIGLLATNDVVLRDPHVSRLHAVIRWTPTGYEIEDLGSTNGTFVQGVRVTGRMPLPPGATIRIGAAELRLQPAASPTASRAVQPASNSYPPAAPYHTLPAYPVPSGSGAQTSGPAVAARYPYVASRPSRIQAWIQRTAPKRYWRVFLLGLLAYVAADLLLNFDLNRHAVPLVILLASALVPVTFVLYCWEAGAFADMPATVVGMTFVSGAVGGLLVAGFLEDVFLVDVPILGVLMIGVIEEGAKAGAVIWFLRDKRLRSELDGLVLGAAAGMGFATLETAGYGFNAFLSGYTASLAHNSAAGAASMTHATSAGIGAMTGVLVVRMALAVFGHGAWTAIVCAAVWRERGPSVLRITGGVVLAFGIAVALHAIWDSVGDFLPLSLVLLPLTAFAGLWILRFVIHEAVDRAKLGSLAPPPEPLGKALAAYLLHPLRRPTVQPLYPQPAYPQPALPPPPADLR